MGAGYRQPVKIIYKPVGFENQVDITGAFRVEVAKNLPVQPGIGNFPFHQVNAWNGIGDPFKFNEFFRHDPGHFIHIQLMLPDDFII